MIIPTKDMSLETFISSVVVDFPFDNVCISTRPDDWKSWASSLIQENSFASNGAPIPNDYENMNQWAQAVFYSMASFS